MILFLKVYILQVQYECCSDQFVQLSQIPDKLDSTDNSEPYDMKKYDIGKEAN